jgi:hypothetical protein
VFFIAVPKSGITVQLSWGQMTCCTLAFQWGSEFVPAGNSDTLLHKLCRIVQTSEKVPATLERGPTTCPALGFTVRAVIQKVVGSSWRAFHNPMRMESDRSPPHSTNVKWPTFVTNTNRVCGLTTWSYIPPNQSSPLEEMKPSSTAATKK